MSDQKIYCLKCRNFTDNLEPIQRINNKLNRPMIKTKCSICNSTKSRFIKNSTGFGTNILNKIIDVLPEMHMSADVGENVENGDFNNTNKYSFCGPGTKLKKRLKEGYKGINILDQACLKHDLKYDQYSDNKNRNFADNELAKACNEIANNENLSERIRNDAKFVAMVMSAKSYFGFGLS